MKPLKIKKNICSGITAVIAAVAINSFNVPESYGILNLKEKKGYLELAKAVEEGTKAEYKETDREQQIVKFEESIALYNRIEIKKDDLKYFVPNYDNHKDITDLILIVPAVKNYKKTDDSHWPQLLWIFLTKNDSDYLEDKILNGKNFEIHNSTSTKEYDSFKERVHNLSNKLFIDGKLIAEKKPHAPTKVYHD